MELIIIKIIIVINNYDKYNSRILGDFTVYCRAIFSCAEGLLLTFTTSYSNIMITKLTCLTSSCITDQVVMVATNYNPNTGPETDLRTSPDHVHTQAMIDNLIDAPCLCTVSVFPITLLYNKKEKVVIILPLNLLP